MYLNYRIVYDDVDCYLAKIYWDDYGNPLECEETLKLCFQKVDGESIEDKVKREIYWISIASDAPWIDLGDLSYV